MTFCFICLFIFLCSLSRHPERLIEDKIKRHPDVQGLKHFWFTTLTGEAFYSLVWQGSEGPLRFTAGPVMGHCKLCSTESRWVSYTVTQLETISNIHICVTFISHIIFRGFYLLKNVLTLWAAISNMQTSFSVVSSAALCQCQYSNIASTLIISRPPRGLIHLWEENVLFLLV